MFMHKNALKFEGGCLMYGLKYLLDNAKFLSAQCIMQKHTHIHKLTQTYIVTHINPQN